MIRKTRLALLLLTVLGCRAEPTGGMSREKFVRVNVALRMVPDSLPDTQARRTAILRRERVTGAQLERWARAHAGSPVLGETWKLIVARIDSVEVRRRRPAPPPSEGRDPDAAPPPDRGEEDTVPAPADLRELRERFNKPSPPEEG